MEEKERYVYHEVSNEVETYECYWDNQECCELFDDKAVLNRLNEQDYELKKLNQENIKLIKENQQLKQQLAEKEKRCEICGSKMILGELGYYCNNDELHPIYQAPNEAKSDYEKITLLKQDYDAMVEREELLRQQLAEKEQENERLNLEFETQEDWQEKWQKLYDETCNLTQDKISFCIEKFQETKKSLRDKVCLMGNDTHCYLQHAIHWQDVVAIIDNQIASLKKGVE